jgi:hypothetical protein
MEAPLESPSLPSLRSLIRPLPVGQECRNFRIVLQARVGHRVKELSLGQAPLAERATFQALGALRRIGVWVVGDFSENPQSSRAVASGQSGIVIFVIPSMGSAAYFFSRSPAPADSTQYSFSHSSRLNSRGTASLALVPQIPRQNKSSTGADVHCARVRPRPWRADAQCEGRWASWVAGPHARSVCPVASNPVGDLVHAGFELL